MANTATILVVDDRSDNRALLTTLLGYSNHRLLEAADGAAALGLARLESPDLIITDIMMPVMDAAGLLRQLRGDMFHATTPVLLYTAIHDRLEAEELAARYNVYDILTKPCEPEAILSAVARALGGLRAIPDNHHALTPLSPPDNPGRPPSACLEALCSAEIVCVQSKAALAAICIRAATAPPSEVREIAFDLHDRIGPALSAVKLNLQILLRAPAARGLVSRISASIENIDATLREMRSLSRSLPP